MWEMSLRIPSGKPRPTPAITDYIEYEAQISTRQTLSTGS
jgi:hypothetical protein